MNEADPSLHLRDLEPVAKNRPAGTTLGARGHRYAGLGRDDASRNEDNVDYRRLSLEHQPGIPPNWLALPRVRSLGVSVLHNGLRRSRSKFHIQRPQRQARDSELATKQQPSFAQGRRCPCHGGRRQRLHRRMHTYLTHRQDRALGASKRHSQPWHNSRLHLLPAPATGIVCNLGLRLRGATLAARRRGKSL